MSSVDSKPIVDNQLVADDDQLAEEQVQAVVDRAAVLLRLRPVPGSDPVQARMWLKSVADFFASEALRRVLKSFGVRPPADLAKPVEDQSPVVDHLAQMVGGGHEDSPALLVAGLVGAAYLGLVGYAIYWNVTQSSTQAPDAGSPVDAGTPGDAGSPVDAGTSG